ncbi:L-xylulose reductase-like [Xenia sp. Carnegie-2017]|uniref:L-xylulose reductase-like n=1 Tax=Xenia sp. Carnegie-2017 TaxID=2897299 RepID=UPI001F04D638|nr:L-xylulose reductase-like [Xenia sp. Carnegie-2017]
MDIDFKGKTALVTGAGKGIGRATVKLLSKCGANIVALSRTKSDLDSLKDEVSTKFVPVVADLMKLDDAIKAIEATGEPIDLLVNNAAMVILKETLDVTDDDIDRSVTINMKAPLRLSQFVARDLIKRKKPGAIVNISTTITQFASAGYMPYTMSKAALDNATIAMAAELAKHKIRVNSVLPGLVDTPFATTIPREVIENFLVNIPRGERASSEDIADTIVYLLSDRASNIVGSKIVSDGGMFIK